MPIELIAISPSIREKKFQGPFRGAESYIEISKSGLSKVQGREYLCTMFWFYEIIEINRMLAL